MSAWLRRWLRSLSIRRKLTLIVLVTSGVAVVLASAVFLAWDYVLFRERWCGPRDDRRGHRPARLSGARGRRACAGRGSRSATPSLQIVGSLQAAPRSRSR